MRIGKLRYREIESAMPLWEGIIINATSDDDSDSSNIAAVVTTTLPLFQMEENVEVLSRFIWIPASPLMHDQIKQLISHCSACFFTCTVWKITL